MSANRAWARFFRAVSAAAAQLAADLEAIPESVPPDYLAQLAYATRLRGAFGEPLPQERGMAGNRSAGHVASPPPDWEEDAEEAPAGTPPEMLAIGSRQRQILQIPELRGEEGLKTKEIARLIKSSDVPNVYLAMRALEKRGLVELVPNTVPQHWRLAPKFRGHQLNHADGG